MLAKIVTNLQYEEVLPAQSIFKISALPSPPYIEALNLEKIVFHWQGLTLMEPIGVIFNWLIAAQCFHHGVKLKAALGKESATRYWVGFYWLFAGSTLFGGLSHLLFFYFDLAGKIPGWSLAILSMAFLEAALLVQAQKKSLLWVIWVQTALLYGLLAYDFRFLWVSIQTLIGLVVVSGGVSFIQIKKGDKAWIGYWKGISWMFLSLPFVLGEIDLSLWFNRHDVSHILMMLCLWTFYRTTVEVVVAHYLHDVF